MKLVTIFIALLMTVAVAAQPTLYIDATAGLTSRVQGRINIDPGIILADRLSLEANLMIGEMEGIDFRYGATAGYEFGKRPFALRLYAGGNYGQFYRSVHLSEGYDVDITEKVIRPIVGAKLLYGSGAVDLRYTTYDFSLTIGFQVRELVHYFKQTHKKTYQKQTRYKQE